MGLRSLGNPNSDFDDYTVKTGEDASGASAPGVALNGITASGGTTNTYFIGELKYKSHTFTNGQTFQVTALSEDTGNYPNTIDLLLVGGGGGAAVIMMMVKAAEAAVVEYHHLTATVVTV